MKSLLFSSKMKNKTNWRRIINLILIPVTAVVGDTVIQSMNPNISLLLKCFTDSATHFLLASFSWNYVETSSMNKRIHLVVSIMCGLLASIIDIDHFIAVGTISLQVNIITISNRNFYIWLSYFDRQLHLCLIGHFYIVQLCLQLLLCYLP